MHVGDALKVTVERQQRAARHEVVESVHLRAVADVELTSAHATVHAATTNMALWCEARLTVAQ